MKCTIPGNNVKVFVRAIHCLGKIGDELYFEPLEQGLALRTVNSSRSAFASFLFAPSFFLQYKNGLEPEGNQGSEEEGVRCKVAMKSILSVFRSPTSVEKNVERCKISLSMTEARLVFKLHCRHGIIKTHNLAFIECETLQAIVSKDTCSNMLTAAANRVEQEVELDALKSQLLSLISDKTLEVVLCDAVVNFQTTLEEVTMIANENKFVLKNFVEDESDPSKVVHTQLSLVPKEFDVYQIHLDVAITFCLKEFRAILGFAELTALPLTIHFDGPGSPVVFTVDGDATFEGTFVLATLSEMDNGPPGSQTQPATSQARNSHPSSRQAGTKGKPKASSGSKQKKANGHGLHRSGACKGLRRGDLEPSDAEAMMEEEVIDITADVTTVLPKPGPGHPSNSTRNLPPSPPPPRPSTSWEEPGSPVFPSRTALRGCHGRNGAPSSPPPQCTGNRDDGGSPVFPQRESARKLALNVSAMADVMENACEDRSIRMELQQECVEEEEDEFIPGTPPSKKFRSLFFGSQSSTVPTQTQPPTAVLAADTDDED